MSNGRVKENLSKSLNVKVDEVKTRYIITKADDFLGLQRGLLTFTRRVT